MTMFIVMLVYQRVLHNWLHIWLIHGKPNDHPCPSTVFDSNGLYQWLEYLTIISYNTIVIHHVLCASASIDTMWGHRWIAKLVQITPMSLWFMVDFLRLEKGATSIAYHHAIHTQWPWLRNRLIGGTYHIFEAYFLGPNFREISPQNMAKHMVRTNVPPSVGSWRSP